MKLFRTSVTMFILFFLVSFSFAQIEPKKLFHLDSIPILVIYVSENGWNTLLANYERNKFNNEKIKIDKIAFYQMNKGKYTEEVSIEGGELSIKGNMSRLSPEVPPHRKEAGIYHQCNFKLKFGKKDTYDQNDQNNNIYGYDSVDLKFFRNDIAKCREILTTSLLQQTLPRFNSGETLAPYIGFVHFYIGIKGDKHPENNFNPLDPRMIAETGYHCYNYGLYNIIESPTSKAFLESRFGSSTDKDGYMFKCGYQSAGQANYYLDLGTHGQLYSLDWYEYMVNNADYNNGKNRQKCKENLIFGVKYAPLTEDNWEYNPPYAFDGKEDSFKDSVRYIAGFIYNLNKLEGAELVNWLETGTVPSGFKNPFSPEINSYKFDIDSFINTMAVIQMCGAFDSYWHNSNNFAFYINNQNKTVYFIAHDLKFTFGNVPRTTKIQPPLGRHDLFNISYGNDVDFFRQSLISNLLKIQNYKYKYKRALINLGDKMMVIHKSGYFNIGSWYSLICDNFDQTHCIKDGHALKPEEIMRSNSKYPKDYVYNEFSNKYLRIPDDITKEDNQVSWFSRIVIDYPEHADWVIHNYRIFSVNNVWDGNEKTIGNWISTSIDNMERQVK